MNSIINKLIMKIYCVYKRLKYSPEIIRRTTRFSIFIIEKFWSRAQFVLLLTVNTGRRNTGDKVKIAKLGATRTYFSGEGEVWLHIKPENF